MTISVNWLTRVVTVPTTFMSLVSGPGGPGSTYELNVNAFRLALKDIEDDAGMPFPDTHRHNTAVTLGGVTYARTFEMINGFTVEFDESVHDNYTVRCVGANHNLADVKTVNTISLIVNNAAGLIVTTVGSGLSTEQDDILREVHQRLGLGLGKPLVQTQTTISTPDFALAITEVPGQVTVTRQ